MYGKFYVCKQTNHTHTYCYKFNKYSVTLWNVNIIILFLKTEKQGDRAFYNQIAQEKKFLVFATFCKYEIISKF